MNVSEEKAVLTCKDIQALGIAGRTKLYFMVKNGDFPKPLKYGRAIRWRKIDVEDWLKYQAQKANIAGNKRVWQA